MQVQIRIIEVSDKRGSDNRGSTVVVRLWESGMVKCHFPMVLPSLLRAYNCTYPSHLLITLTTCATRYGFFFLIWVAKQQTTNVCSPLPNNQRSYKPECYVVIGLVLDTEAPDSKLFACLFVCCCLFVCLNQGSLTGPCIQHI